MPVAVPRDEQEGEGEMFVLSVELGGRGTGDAVRPQLSSHLTRGYFSAA